MFNVELPVPLCMLNCDVDRSGEAADSNQDCVFILEVDGPQTQTRSSLLGLSPALRITFVWNTQQPT